MSLVKVKEQSVRPWNSAGARRIRLKLPSLQETPTIDYDKLKWLCGIEGLKGRNDKKSTDEAHMVFMDSYEDIFVKKPKKVGFPIHTEKRSEQHKTSLESFTHNATGKTSSVDKTVAGKEYPIDELTYDIRDYLPLLHKQRKSEDPDTIRAENIRTLRRLAKKLPFERTADDNDKMFNILQTFPFFKENIPENVLKELCVIAVLETWKDQSFTVFGNTGLHLILKGTVTPLTHPYLNKGTEEDQNLRTPTPLIINEPEEFLTVGDCFGTLQKVEGRDQSSKVYSVMTKDPHCEFLKIPSSRYAKVIEQIQQRENTEKINLLLSCGQYKLWPTQPLEKVASLIEWIKYPPNTVLVSEGYQAPFMGFIKVGYCHVLRMVEVMQALPNGKRERRSKQVVMGKLGPSDSFAELSVLLNEQITCSIVTETKVELGIIRPDRLQELDEVTIQLFKQSNTRTFGNLTKNNIQEEYVQQELKREWNEFKHSIVMDVINSRGIRPGYGKWAK
ncbi:hypothetical protein ACJMK2_008854 [Sinanodonta woodiana]|uniref:Cyclic nucleotide-binding domain-containing protein n=1 Tax=Sinanodonta woodiana TaxID=1069815 RepID=A0ABD3VDF0_SINWO